MLQFDKRYFVVFLDETPKTRIECIALRNQCGIDKIGEKTFVVIAQYHDDIQLPVQSQSSTESYSIQVWDYIIPTLIDSFGEHKIHEIFYRKSVEWSAVQLKNGDILAFQGGDVEFFNFSSIESFIRHLNKQI